MTFVKRQLIRFIILFFPITNLQIFPNAPNHFQPKSKTAERLIQSAVNVNYRLNYISILLDSYLFRLYDLVACCKHPALSAP